MSLFHTLIEASELIHKICLFEIGILDFIIYILFSSIISPSCNSYIFFPFVKATIVSLIHNYNNNKSAHKFNKERKEKHDDGNFILSDACDTFTIYVSIDSFT